MLVKLAFVMQRLKIYPKKFLSLSTKMGGQFLDFRGDTAVMRGDIELMAGPPSPPPPLGKTLETRRVIKCHHHKHISVNNGCKLVLVLYVTEGFSISIPRQHILI